MSLFQAIGKTLMLLSALAAFAGLSGCGSGSADAPTVTPVGRAAFDWTDPARNEKYGPAPGSPRKIGVYVWYPAAPAPNATPGPIITDGQASALAPLSGIPKQSLLTLPTRSYINAPVSDSRRSYPVLLMSHGNDTPLLAYSSTAEYLASHGYIVVGVSHTYNSTWTLFADDTIEFHDDKADVTSVLPALTTASSYADLTANYAGSAALDADLTRDLSFALDRLAALNTSDGPLKGRLHLDQIGVFGHSYGGSHAFRMLKEDARILAAADLDGTIYNENYAAGAAKPLLVIQAARPTADQIAAFRSQLLASGLTGAQADSVLAEQSSERHAYAASSRAYLVQLLQAQHANFTDFGLLKSYGFPQDNISTTADPGQLLDISNSYLRAFFDETVRGAAAPLLHRSPASPNVTLERRP